MILLVKQGEKSREELAAKLGVSNLDAAEPVAAEGDGSDPGTLPIYYLPDDEAEGNAAFAQRLEFVKGCLSEGEQLSDRQFGITVEGHELFHPNSPVVKATSNLTEYIAIFDEYLYDNGEFRERDILHIVDEPAPELEAILVGNPVAMFLAKEFAKALGKRFAKDLYRQYIKPDNDQSFKDELEKMKTELRQIVAELFQESKYEKLEDQLITARAWLVGDLSRTLETIANGDYDEKTLKDLKKQLQERETQMHDIASIIEARLPDSALRDCDYITRVKAVLYAATACLRVLLYKELIYIKNLLNNNTSADKKNVDVFLKKAAEQLDHYVEELHTGRLSKISELTHYDQRTEHLSWSSFFTGCYVYRGEAGYEWRDEFESKNPNDPFRGPKLHEKFRTSIDNTDYRMSPVREAGRAARNKHIEEVELLFNEYISIPLKGVADELRATTIEIKAREELPA